MTNGTQMGQTGSAQMGGVPEHRAQQGQMPQTAPAQAGSRPTDQPAQQQMQSTQFKDWASI